MLVYQRVCFYVVCFNTVLIVYPRSVQICDQTNLGTYWTRVWYVLLPLGVITAGPQSASALV
jgi:hypothetical protein